MIAFDTAHAHARVCVLQTEREGNHVCERVNACNDLFLSLDLD